MNIGERVNVNVSERNEGFWYSEYEKHLPTPKAFEGEWGRDAFLCNLIELEDLLMSTYQAVVDMYNDGDCEPYNKYKESKSGVVESRGFSICRVCECANGSRTFVRGGFMWPDGFRHYIEEHNVKPSDDFIDMVNGKNVRDFTEDYNSEIEIESHNVIEELCDSMVNEMAEEEESAFLDFIGAARDEDDC